MAFKEFNPQQAVFEKDGDFVEGVLIKIQKDIGENKSMLYSIQEEKGNVKNVWGSTILDEKMSFISPGSRIRITYKGLSNKSTKGKKPAKIFIVEIDEDYTPTLH